MLPSSVVIDHLLSYEPTASGTFGVASFYFDFSEPDQYTPAEVLSNLLKQLASQLLQLPKQLKSLYDLGKRDARRPTPKELRLVLKDTCSQFHRTFIVCDALDECPPQHRPVLLQSFQDMARCGCKIFITSRPQPQDIQRFFQGAPRIEVTAKKEDLECYIDQRINSSATRFSLKNRAHEEFITSLIEAAEGMYVKKKSIDWNKH